MSGGTYKVVLLGEGRVGKTSLVSRFVKDEFDSEQASTVQANMYNKKRIVVEDGVGVDLSIWDTAGQERFHALGPIYYRNSNGAVLVYDCTDADTFDRTKMWLKELKQVVGDGIKIVICGNKADLEKDRMVTEEQAVALAKHVGAVHFSTSAKTNMNVSEAFQYLAEEILKEANAGGLGASSAGGGKKGKAGAPKGRGGKKGVKIDLGGGDEAPATNTGSSSLKQGEDYVVLDDEGYEQHSAESLKPKASKRVKIDASNDSMTSTENTAASPSGKKVTLSDPAPGGKTEGKKEKKCGCIIS